MPTNAAVQIPGKKEQDLSWISIFAENNKVVDIGSGYWVINGKKAPIFNFKINSVANLKYLEDGISTFLIHGATTLILGKNFEISLIAPNLNTSKLVLSSGIFYQTGFTPEKTCLIAQYGFKFKTNVGVLMYPFNRMILNDGEITLNQFPKHDESRRGYFGMPVGKDAKISNVVVHCNRTKPDLSASAVFHCSDNAILKNVTSTDRINTIKALISRGGKVILENCNFSSRTKGTADNGHDIFIQGYNKDARIYLKKTTGNLNQRLNKATNKGTIMLG
jgi:hypothetical protein